LIYQETLRFLKQHIKRPTVDFKWKELDNIAFFNVIYKKHSLNEVLEEISEIRQAFRMLFEPIGVAIVRYDEITGIGLKVIPYSVKPAQSKHLNSIIEIILSNRNQIEHPFNGKKNQLALKGKIRRNINAELEDSDESVNKKDLIKYAIKKALKLTEKDVVLLRKRRYIVRFFDTNRKVEHEISKDEELDEVYQLEELASDYDDFFEEVDMKNFLDIVIDSVMKNELSFEKSDNFYYENNAHKIIRKAISKELEKYIDDDVIYRDAFSEYIFRTNFVRMHERIAIVLLEEIVNKNNFAESFIKYYSGETILRHGKKYQIPSLESSEGGKWNVVSVISIASLFIKTRNKKGDYTVEYNKLVSIVADLKEKHDKVHVKFEAYCNMKEKVQNAIELAKEQLEQTQLTFRAHSKDSLNDDEKHRLLREEKEYERRVVELQDKVIEIEKVRLSTQRELFEKKEFLKTYETKLSNVKSEIRSLEQNLMVNSGSYQTILTSLTKALMQRKRVI
jgi:hypothetical protein